MVRSGLGVGDFEQLLEGKTLHGLAHAFAVLAFFHPPVPDLFDDFLDLGVRSFTGDEGHQQRTHLGAVHHGGLGAHQDAGAAFVTDVQGAGHGVDAVHAAHAVGGLDGQLAAVPAHALGGAAVHHFGLDVELAPVTTGMGTGVGFEFAAHVGFHGVLVDLDVVLPRTHDGKVGTGHSGHAAVRAAVELELELVGEGGTVQFVVVVLGQLVAHVLGVVAGIFAAGLAEAGFGGTQVGAGTTEVDMQFVGQVVEDFFQLRGLGAQEHDVTGGAVHVGHAGTAQVPDVAQVTQEFGVVVFGSGLGHTHGVEVGHAGELFGLVAVTADDAAAVTEHAHDAAVLPVGFLFFVGKFQHTEQVFGGVSGDLIVQPVRIGRAVSRFLFDVGHEARPGAGFKLVQQGGCMFRHCHTSTWFVVSHRVMCLRHDAWGRSSPEPHTTKRRRGGLVLRPAHASGVPPQVLFPVRRSQTGDRRRSSRRCWTSGTAGCNAVLLLLAYFFGDDNRCFL